MFDDDDDAFEPAKRMATGGQQKQIVNNNVSDVFGEPVFPTLDYLHIQQTLSNICIH